MDETWLIVTVGLLISTAALVTGVMLYTRAHEPRELLNEPWSRGWLYYGAKTGPQP